MPTTTAASALCCRYRDVFGPGTAHELLQLATAKAPGFQPSKTSRADDYPDWRRSTVLYHHEFEHAVTRLRAAIEPRLPEVLEILGLAPFAHDYEIQLTSHNDGEYYHWHTDSGTPETRDRQLTFVYYLHAQPKRFDGGDLWLHQGDAPPIVLPPKHDTLVFFRAETRHEVRPVRCPSGTFADGRFTFNGWLRAKRDPVDGFDARIFAPAWAPAPPRGVAHDRVDEIGDLDQPTFAARYAQPRRPFVWRRRLADTPAVRDWSPERLAARFGDVEIEITDQRARDPEYEPRFEHHRRSTTIAALVERLRREPKSNDYYAVARNYFFDQPRLRGLVDELCPPPDLVRVDDRRRGTAKLWLGPGGTVTPLHRDAHGILFAQVYGTKHVKLIRPDATAELGEYGHHYSRVDPERPDLGRFPGFADLRVHDVVLEPGDLLYLPEGWWHWVRALSPSISATFCSLAGH